jgi:AhpC/TSA antioxidant enzyme
VATGADWQARRLLDDGYPFPCLVDPEARLYDAIGTGRLTWRSLFDPRNWRNYLRARRAGHRHGISQGEVTGDWRRLPGVVVVDRGGIVRLVHRAAALGDYPRVEALVEIARAGSAPPG